MLVVVEEDLLDLERNASVLVGVEAEDVAEQALVLKTTPRLRANVFNFAEREGELQGIFR